MAQELGRREAAKAATRKALQQAGVRLFALHGFMGTTVQQIADEAGVTERTFFRYFGSKDELLADLVLGGLPLLQAAIVARPAGEAPLVAVRNALAETIEAADANGEHPIVARLFEEGPPGLRLGMAGATLLLRLEAAVAEALLARAPGACDDTPPGDSDDERFRAEVLAAVSVAATRRALMRNGPLLARGQSSREELVGLLRGAFDAVL